MENGSKALYAFRKFGDTVLRAAYSCCGCYSEAEDITQDVFLLLHSKNPDFNDDEHMKAWLLRVTINKCKNYKRSFRVSHTQALETVENSASYNMDTSDIEIREILSALPQKYSAVIYLYYYEGMTLKEISKILGKNVNTISSLLRRGREKLRLEMTEETSTRRATYETE